MFRDERPGVVLVVLDATRADHLSCYGHGRRTTPNLDALAAEGTLYRTAWSGSTWTVPAVASLFTGSLPSGHGTSRAHPFLDTPRPTLAELLAGAGYETYGVSNNSWVSSATRFSRGFETFDKVWQLVQDPRDPLADRMVGSFSGEGFRAKDLVRSLASGNPVRNFLNAAYGKVLYKKTDSGAARVNRLVRRWLSRRDRGRPPMMFVHYLEPHLPFRPPAEWKRRFLPEGVDPSRADRVSLDAWAHLAGQEEMSAEDREIYCGLYDAAIAYLDHRLGELFSMLDDHGLLSESLIAVTADHGEHLGEHGLLDHQYSVYEPLLRVPLLVKRPGVAGGVEVEGLVQSFDLFSDIVSTAAAEDPAADLRDARPLPEHGAAGREHLLAEYPEPQPSPAVLEARFPGFDASRLDRSLRAVRTERFKYILSSRGEEELYDLARDPEETVNVVLDHPLRARELATILEDRFGDAPGAPQEGEGMEALDGELRKRLEALGYLS